MTDAEYENEILLADCPDCGEGAPQEWQDGVLRCSICNEVILDAA